MKFGSLFAGIGGFDLGLERAGMTPAWQVEIDPWCRKVLAKHWPHVQRFEDVRNVGRDELGTVDLICGGFPCQDVSLAGTRAGMEGTRSSLWTEFFRIVCEIRPRWIVVENVPGLYTSDNGRFFSTILGNLASGGYDAEWNTLSAALVGAAHLRERVFVVAYAKGILGDVGPFDSLRRITRTRKEWEFRRCDFGTLPLGSDWNLYQPSICRADDGISDRVDRLKGLGNAVVPQVVEWIGRMILEADAHE